MGQKYRSLLTSLGLTDNEIVLYDLLLREGPRSASALADRTDLTRTNTYYILGQLIQKQLIARDNAAGKTVFRAEHPDAVRDLLFQKRQNLEDIRRELEEEFPELVSDYGLGEEKPGVYRFSGRKGLIRAYDEILRDRSPISSIKDRAQLRPILSDYYLEFVRRRVELGLRHRMICPQGTIPDGDDANELREVRYIPRGLLPFDVDLKIARNKVLVVKLREGNASGIIVHDPGIAKSFLALFEFVWNSLS